MPTTFPLPSVPLLYICASITGCQHRHLQTSPASSPLLRFAPRQCLHHLCLLPPPPPRSTCGTNRGKEWQKIGRSNEEPIFWATATSNGSSQQHFKGFSLEAICFYPIWHDSTRRCSWSPTKGTHIDFSNDFLTFCV
jgi:hypothetical protein